MAGERDRFPGLGFKIVQSAVGVLTFFGTAGPASAGPLTLVGDIYEGPTGSQPKHLTDFGGTLYFSADSAGRGLELWSATGAGASLVKDILAGASSGQPQDFVVAGNTLFFTAYSGSTTNRELWASDGTSAGTRLVQDLWSGGSSDPKWLTPVGSLLFFVAADAAEGKELYRSDGTPEGTKRFKAINPGTGNSTPSGLVDADGNLYFAASDGTASGRHGFELWKTDGTPDNTVMVKDIAPGTLGSEPQYLRYVRFDRGPRVVFSAKDSTGDRELWSSDGTDAGTARIANIRPAGSSNPQHLTVLGNKLYFVATGPGGAELWVTDGTEAGTVQVKDIVPGAAGSSPGGLTSVGDTLFFLADDVTNGIELWKTDGTEAGTVLVKDIAPGPRDAVLLYPTNIGGTLMFMADDSIHGRQVWVSDGTEAGTVILDVLNPAGAAPNSFTLSGDRVYLSALHPTLGQELWSMPMDLRPPHVESVVPADPNPTGAAAVRFTVAFSEDVTGVDATDFRLETSGVVGATVTDVSGTGRNWTVTVGTGAGEGTLRLDVVDDDTILDAAGNYLRGWGPGGDFTQGAAYTLDRTPPTLTLGAPSVSVTKNGPVTYTINYLGADSVTLAPRDIQLNASGSVSASVAVSGTGTASRTVTLSGIGGTGSLGISIAPGTATDAAGNPAPAAGPSTPFAVDNTPPAVTLSAPSAAVTRSGPVTYTITYAGADTVSLTAADVLLHRTGSAQGTVSVSGSGTSTRTVTIAGITGDGTLSISLAAGTASDAVGNLAAAAGPGAAFAVDNKGPDVVLGAPSVSATAAGPVTFAVGYAGAASVTLSASDVTLHRTGTATAKVGIAGSGATGRTVTLSDITGDGSLAISIAAGTAADALGNPAAAAGPSAGVTVDNTAPTVDVGAPSTTATRTGPVTFAVTYNGADSVALTAADVALHRTGTADGTVAVSGSGTTARTVTISGITGDGTLGISLAGATAFDGVGNPAAAAGPSAVVAVDNTPPTVAVGAPSVAATRSGPVHYTVTYGGATGVSLSNAHVTLIKTGTAAGAVAVTGSGTTARTVTVYGVTGNGTLAIGIAAGTATDAVGNTAPAIAASSAFEVDNTPPTIVLSGPEPALTRSGPVEFRVEYAGETAVSLAPADVTVHRTGTAECGSVEVGPVAGEPHCRAVRLTGLTGDGTLRISVAGGTATDAAGNPAKAAGPSAPVTLDNTPPTVSIGPPSVALTAGGPVSFTIAYDGATSVTLTNLDVFLEKTGTANGTCVVTGTGTTARTVTISGITGDGTLALGVVAGTAADAAGNSAPAVGPGAAFVVDNTGPALYIGLPSSEVTAEGPVAYEVRYAGASAVTLSAADVALVRTGTADGAVSVAGSGPASRTVMISGITGDGTLAIAIGAGTALDAAGNPAPAAGPGAAFVVDNTPPGVSVEPPSVTVTRHGPVAFALRFDDELIVELEPDDVLLNPTGTATGTVRLVPAKALEYGVVIENIDGDGTLRPVLAAGAARDAGGNALGPVPLGFEVTVDNTPPVLTLRGASVIETPLNYGYTDPRVAAVDNTDGDLSKAVVVSGAVDVSREGDYVLTYSVSDRAGNAASVTRTVRVSADAEPRAPLTAWPLALALLAAGVYALRRRASPGAWRAHR